MRKTTWKSKIKSACKSAGTYRPYFDFIIDTLSSTLETRDKALKQYEDSGSNPVVIYTNKNGNKNMTKNPALVAVDDLNRTALAYWRDLGLTPAGLKKIDEKAMKAKGKSALAEALSGLG